MVQYFSGTEFSTFRRLSLPWAEEAEASAAGLASASERLLTVEAAVTAACNNPLLRSWRVGASLLVPRSGVAPASTLLDVPVGVALVAAGGRNGG